MKNCDYVLRKVPLLDCLCGLEIVILVRVLAVHLSLVLSLYFKRVLVRILLVYARWLLQIVFFPRTAHHRPR